MDEVRDARILVAGEYPDKQLALTEADLDAIAQAHDAPVPLLVEHKPTLTLGWVESLARKGRELWGKVRLLPEAAKLIAQSGVRTLSAGLMRQPLKLREVSLVSHPRIPEASLLSDDLAYLPDGEVMMMTATTQPEPQTTPARALNDEAALAELRAENEQLKAQIAQLERAVADTQATDALQQRLAELERQLAEREAEFQVDAWTREYGLTPAQAAIARKILLSDRVELSADETPAKLFAQFIETLPKPQPEAVQRHAFGVDEAATIAMLRQAGFQVGESLTPEARALLQGGGRA